MVPPFSTYLLRWGVFESRSLVPRHFIISLCCCYFYFLYVSLSHPTPFFYGLLGHPTRVLARGFISSLFSIFLLIFLSCSFFYSPRFHLQPPPRLSLISQADYASVSVGSVFVILNKLYFIFDFLLLLVYSTQTWP